MTSTTSISDKAGEAYDWFVSKERETPEGIEVFYSLKDDHPQWITDVVREAHNGMLPDDWKYECAMSAIGYIHDNDSDEGDSGEFADQQVDVYNGDRLQWLASNLNRPGYCDEARDEFGPEIVETIMQWIGLGQYMEASEIYGLVYSALQTLVDDED